MCVERKTKFNERQKLKEDMKKLHVGILTLALAGFAVAISGRAEIITVSLYDNSGTPGGGSDIDATTAPGSPITTLGTIDVSTLAPGINNYTVSLLNNPTITAGTRYWIYLSSTGDTSGWAWAADDSGTGVAGEFRVEGSDRSFGHFVCSESRIQIHLPVSARNAELYSLFRFPGLTTGTTASINQPYLDHRGGDFIAGVFGL